MENRMGLVQAARQLSSYGRGPDTHLAHVAPDEMEFLDYMQGGARVNPHTGLHEYSLFGKILKAVARVAGAVGGFMIGGPAGAALGSAAATKLTGGSWKDSLKAGALSGIGGEFTQGLTGSGWNVLGNGTPLASALGQGAASAGAAGASGAQAVPAMPTGASGGISASVASQAGSNLGASPGFLSSMGSSVPAIPGGAASGLKSMLAPIGGYPGAVAGLGALSTPLSSNASLPASSGPPPGYGAGINLNVKPMNRHVIPYTGDDNKFGESSRGWKFFDEINPQPEFITPTPAAPSPLDVGLGQMYARGGQVHKYAQGGALDNKGSWLFRATNESGDDASGLSQLFSAPAMTPEQRAAQDAKWAQMMPHSKIMGGYPSTAPSDAMAIMGSTRSIGSVADTLAQSIADRLSSEPKMQTSQPAYTPQVAEGNSFPDPDTFRGRMEIQGGPLAAKPGLRRITKVLEDHGMEWTESPNGNGITAYSEVVGPNGKVFKEGKNFNEKTSLRTLRNWLGYARGGPVGRYALGGGVGALRQPGGGLAGIGGMRTPGMPNGISGPSMADPMQIHASLHDFSPDAMRQAARRAAIMNYVNAKGGGSIKGPGTGTSDDIPAMLSDGEHVVDAATISAAGNGSNEAGQREIEKWKQKQRKKAGVKNPRRPPAFQGAANG